MEKHSHHHLFGIVFAAVAILHLIRAVAGFELTIAGYQVPIWLNLLVAIIAGYLAYLGFREG